MTASATRPGKWRIRWAERENAHRGRAYAAAIDAWSGREADLRAMRAAGASYSGRHDDGSLPVALRRDERIYLTLSGVQAVEAPNAAELAAVTPALPPTAATWGPVPAGIRVGDSGTAVVTTRRLLFLGPTRNREWSYDKLTGLIHDPIAPMTMMQVSNRKTTSGVLIHPAAAASFRFNLQLAIVEAAGDRAALVAHLDQLIGEHLYRRPTPPILAEPGHAPAHAAWSPLRIVGVAAAVFVLLICVVGVFLPNPPVKPTPGPGLAVRAATTAPAAPAIAIPATTPSASSPAVVSPAAVTATTGSAASPASAAARPSPAQPPAAPKPAAKPAPKPKPKPKPINLCGAPQNPAVYTFCGGSLIRSPDDGACLYFACIDAFDDGKGYMIQCMDGMLSMSGGRPGSCSHHRRQSPERLPPLSPPGPKAYR
jgi:hypothetical protein